MSLALKDYIVKCLNLSSRWFGLVMNTNNLQKIFIEIIDDPYGVVSQLL